MPTDIAGLVKANEKGFALLAVVQGTRSDLLSVEQARTAAVGKAKADYESALGVVQAQLVKTQRDLSAKYNAIGEAEQKKVNEATALKTKAEADLRNHQEETKKQFGTTLDFEHLLRGEVSSGGSVRL